MPRCNQFRAFLGPDSVCRLLELRKGRRLTTEIDNNWLSHHSLNGSLALGLKN
jgi:hypothetical protein